MQGTPAIVAPGSSVNVNQHQLNNSVFWKTKNSCCICVHSLQFDCHFERRISLLKMRPLKYGAGAAGFDGNGPVWPVKAISRKTRVLISVSSPHYPTPFPAESHTEPKAGAFKVRQECTHMRRHARRHTHQHARMHTHRWGVHREADLIQCVRCWLKTDAAASRSFKAFKHSHSSLYIILYQIWIFPWPHIFMEQIRYFANCKPEFQIKGHFFCTSGHHLHIRVIEIQILFATVLLAVSHDGLVKETFVKHFHSSTLKFRSPWINPI